MKLVPTESNILSSICEYLSLRRHFFFRLNNTPVFQENRYRAMSKWTPKGLPDIVVILDGCFIALEVKRKGAYQRPEQKEMQKKIEEAGGTYFVVRSVEDVQKIGL